MGRDDLDAQAETLRALITQAHGATKDLVRALAEARKVFLGLAEERMQTLMDDHESVMRQRLDTHKAEIADTLIRIERGAVDYLDDVFRTLLAQIQRSAVEAERSVRPPRNLDADEILATVREGRAKWKT